MDDGGEWEGWRRIQKKAGIETNEAASQPPTGLRNHGSTRYRACIQAV